MREPVSHQQALSIAAIRALEAQGFARGLPMMEQAGQSAAAFANEQLRPASRILCLVGPGNNGGDALVAARQLQALGHEVIAVMPVASPQASADAKQALAQWLAASGRLVQTFPEDKPDLVVDGLFGIGLDRPLPEPFQSVVHSVNAWQVPILALDIPTGLAADTAQTLGQPIRARWTLAFLAPSLATGLAQGQRYCGQCWLEDLDLKSA